MILNRLNLIKAVVTTVAVVFVALISWTILIPIDSRSQDTTEVVIPAGSGLSEIGDLLAQQNLIRSRFVFQLYVAGVGDESRLKAGTYDLNRNMNLPTIVRYLVQGLAKSSDREVVIPEGFNIWDIDKRLSDVGLNAGKNFAMTYYLKEGRLFPDTYRFDKDATNKDIAAKLQQTFVSKIGGRSQDQVIVASILEKEAKSPEDMAMVAGIIVKRLALGMPLQVDASVGYGWCLRQSLQNGFTKYCNVAQAPIATEIKKDSDHNTYTRVGLPLGPIANPGRAALDAAGHPQTSDYLYYLSTKDGSQIIYSKTLDEHLKNRRKYLGF